MGRPVFKIGHQGDTCYNVTMFTNHISIIVTILGAITNIIGRAYVIISKVGRSSFWSFITFAWILLRL